MPKPISKYKVKKEPKDDGLGSYGGRKILAVWGEGYKREFTEEEGAKIERKRAEMAERVFKIG